MFKVLPPGEHVGLYATNEPSGCLFERKEIYVFTRRVFADWFSVKWARDAFLPQGNWALAGTFLSR